MGIVDASSLGFSSNPPWNTAINWTIWNTFRNIFILKNNKFYRSSSNFSLHFSHVSEGKQLREKTLKNNVCSAGYDRRDL